MKDSTFTVQEQAIIIRRYKDIGITSTLQAFHIPSAQRLPARFYNGRIAYQYKNLRVGLTTLRKQPRCHLVLTIEHYFLFKLLHNYPTLPSQTSGFPSLY